MNLFIGTNASGKSNFFDALRVLQGIGYGFTISEILDGKPKGATSDVWEGIRGGSAKAAFIDTEPGEDRTKRISLSVKLSSEGDDREAEYSLTFNANLGSVREERLSSDGIGTIFDSTEIHNRQDAVGFKVRYYTGNPGRQPEPSFEKSRPVLHQIGARRECSALDRETVESVARRLSNMQRIDPDPTLLRGYSQAHSLKRMGEHGENFAALIKMLCESPKTKEALMAWLRELRPAEVDDVLTLSGALGEPLFALRERGREFPAPVLSDGTLRFAAITAAFFQPDLPSVLTIEEIEKGVHASRLRLLIELLKTQAQRGHVQIMATTHSRSVLDWLVEDDYPYVFFCHRDPDSGETKILPLTEVPHLLEAVRRERLGDLFAENWLEAAL